MIIFKTQGGLGNQLFQYAAALQLSIVLKSGLNLDNSFFYDKKTRVHFRLDKFKIGYSETNLEFDNTEELSLINKIRYYLFRNTPLLSDPGLNIINGDELKYPISSLMKLNRDRDFLICGWLQKTVYFSQVRNILSETLWLINNEPVDRSISKRISELNSVAVHIRRGDMAINPNFVMLGSNYYLNAVRKILELTSNPHFFIFSDEPEKAIELFRSIDVPKTFIMENSHSLGYYGTKGDYIDFELMRLCKHYIIANSTFSWWPAYLCQYSDSIVITPEIWYQNATIQNQFQKSGLLLNNWIIQ